MRLWLVAGLASALMVPAVAADTASLNAFVRSCSSEAKSCQLITLNAVRSARNAKYGCIPADVSDERAGEKLYDWLKDVANKDPKYAGEPLADLFWTGIDEVWPCKK